MPVLTAATWTPAPIQRHSPTPFDAGTGLQLRFNGIPLPLLTPALDSSSDSAAFLCPAPGATWTPAPIQRHSPTPLTPALNSSSDSARCYARARRQPGLQLRFNGIPLPLLTPALDSSSDSAAFLCPAPGATWTPAPIQRHSYARFDAGTGLQLRFSGIPMPRARRNLDSSSDSAAFLRPF